MINHSETLTMRSISQLVPYARNSRTHDRAQVAQIKKSIEEFGWTVPVLVDEDGTIIAGHGRVMAASEMGISEVPVIVAKGWSESQKKAYIIADNKIASNAGWDKNLLALELSDLKSAAYDLGVTGFNEKELVQYVATSTEGLTDDDEAPEPPAAPISASGDVWLLGAHRVMCGSATVSADVERLMAGEKADLLLTDPPYNVNYEGKTKDALKIQNDQMSDDGFRLFLREAFTCAFSVMRDGAAFYIWHADSEGYNFRGAIFDIGEKVRQCLIWVKDTMVMGRQDYHLKHEPCLYGWKEGAAHTWASDRKQVTTIECKRPTKNTEHPTMKPVELMEYQVGNNTNAGHIVLDLFGGSGSTLIACEKTGRACRMMELDPKYVDVIVNRWQAFTGKQAVHAETGKKFDEVKDAAGT